MTEWQVVNAVMRKDLTAVRRSKSTFLPMLLVPAVLLLGLPAFTGWLAISRPDFDLNSLLERFPHTLSGPILSLPPSQQLTVLVNGYLIAPLFLIVPMMVSTVLAADAFAGEKERRTLETLLHLPVPDRDLFLAKLLGAFVPSVALSWAGFVLFAVEVNAIGWGVMGRVFVPTWSWMMLIGWVTPAVALLGLGVMVRVSARTNTTQEANQLGGAVVLPLVIVSVGQSTGLLLVPLWVTAAVGAVIWLVGLLLVRGGMRRFTRDRLAARV